MKDRREREPRNRKYKAPTKKPSVQKSKLKNKISRALELPENVFSDTDRLEIICGREAVVEGCKGVLEYDGEHIKLDMGKTTMLFKGAELIMERMSEQSVVIRGKIASVEFFADK